MIRDKSLLQKREPNSPCEDAKKEGYAQVPKLNEALQGYPESKELTKVREFQQAMTAAAGQQDNDHYQKIIAAYDLADAALAASSEPKAAQVREEAKKMMDIVNKIAPLCQAP
ncbi:hypothetical protein BGZ97_007490 [Linnemannia gamsii]|jgi:predicted nucleic acid-binding Zn ribbon protein|uniref:Uncharacterized protein n=1 Tax=Linnemannia gamsii TaxID=64522 RepID=A0A9P6QPN5_9FUNG|nr:hypothetical protein BGZ97_007490 [Linnemannia gamsii]